jgi:hypothetical protein
MLRLIGWLIRLATAWREAGLSNRERALRQRRRRMGVL